MLHSVQRGWKRPRGASGSWAEPPWPQDMGGWAYNLGTLAGVPVPCDPGSPQPPGWLAVSWTSHSCFCFWFGKESSVGQPGVGDQVGPPQSLRSEDKSLENRAWCSGSFPWGSFRIFHCEMSFLRMALHSLQRSCLHFLT